MISRLRSVSCTVQHGGLGRSTACGNLTNGQGFWALRPRVRTSRNLPQRRSTPLKRASPASSSSWPRCPFLPPGDAPSGAGGKRPGPAGGGCKAGASRRSARWSGGGEAARWGSPPSGRRRSSTSAIAGSRGGEDVGGVVPCPQRLLRSEPSSSLPGRRRSAGRPRPVLGSPGTRADAAGTRAPRPRQGSWSNTAQSSVIDALDLRRHLSTNCTRRSSAETSMAAAGPSHRWIALGEDRFGCIHSRIMSRFAAKGVMNSKGKPNLRSSQVARTSAMTSPWGAPPTPVTSSSIRSPLTMTPDASA